MRTPRSPGPHQCCRPYQSTRPAFWSGTCSGSNMSLHFMIRYAGLLNSPGLRALSMQQSMRGCCRRHQSTRSVPLHGPHQSDRPALRSGTCSGPDMSLHVMTRSAGLLNSPGLQALSMHQSMHQCRRIYQSTRPVLLHGPYQTTRSVLGRGTCSKPDMSRHVMIRSAGLLNAPGPQAFQYTNQCSRAASVINAPGPSHYMGLEHVPRHSQYPLVPTSTRFNPPVPTSNRQHPPVSTGTHQYPPVPTSTHLYRPVPASTHQYPLHNAKTGQE